MPSIASTVTPMLPADLFTIAQAELDNDPSAGAQRTYWPAYRFTTPDSPFPSGPCLVRACSCFGRVGRHPSVAEVRLVELGAGRDACRRGRDDSRGPAGAGGNREQPCRRTPSSSTRPHTTLTLRRAPAPGAMLIEVQDECRGLPCDNFALFRPFAQSGDDRTGLGLRLAIGREASKRTMAASPQNLPDCGCIFTVDLPHQVPAVVMA